jgi:hypothetical protein
VLGIVVTVLCLACGVIVGAVLSGCSIERVVLYETVNYPSVQITPSNRIGPS